MSNKQRGCEMTRYDVTRADLPLSCPTPAQRVWDAHPRVFLPIEKTGKAQCPYCGAQYFLTDHDDTASTE